MSYSKINNKTLLSAVLAGDLPEIKDRVCDTNRCFYDDFEALCWAVENSYFETVKYLVGLGVKCNQEDSLALFCAIEASRLDIVKYLINEGCDPTACSHESIKKAVDAKSFPIVKYLVQQGVDFRAESDTALCWAAEDGLLKIVKFLVKLGADSCAQYNAPLRVACEGGHIETVKFLVLQGAGNKESTIFTEYAAENAHAEVFGYLVSEGFSHAPSVFPVREYLKNKKTTPSKLLKEIKPNFSFMLTDLLRLHFKKSTMTPLSYLSKCPTWQRTYVLTFIK